MRFGEIIKECSKFEFLKENWYAYFFLDWVLFANVKRIRLPGRWSRWCGKSKFEKVKQNAIHI